MKASGMQLIAVVGLVLGLTVVMYGEDDKPVDGYTRAMGLLAKGVVFEALHEMENFAETNPDNEAAHLQMALMLQQLGRERRAAGEAAKVLRINPNNADAHRMLTSIRIKLGRDLDRSDPDAVLDYARLCSRPETYGRAADFYKLYLKMNDSPQVRLEFAKMLYWAQRYDEARQQLKMYLQYNSDDIETHRLLGKIYDTTGNFALAVQEYRRCLTGGDDDQELQLCMARSLMWDGKDQQAEQLLQKICKRSRREDVPLLLAAIARMQGHKVREYELYQDVLKRDPKNAEARKRIQELEQGSLLQESRYLEKLQQDPANITVRHQLVALYISEKRYGEAIPHLEVLNRQVPHDLDLLGALREARQKEGALALQALRNVNPSGPALAEKKSKQCQHWLEKNPNDYATRLVLADLLTEMGSYRDALSQLEILESMTPSASGVIERLNTVRNLARRSDLQSVPQND